MAAAVPAAAISEIVPVVRKAAPTTLWTDEDPYGGRPGAHGRTVPDAAALTTGHPSRIRPLFTS